MKTPLTYYGGKQRLAARIVSLIPEHRIYVEPFVGGGAVFFAKEPSPVEVINDINSELVNFYAYAQRDFGLLEQEIRISLHSRDLHRRAQVIYENPDMFDSLKRAWAVWVLANMSYGAKLDGSFGYDRSGTSSKKIDAKRASFTEEMAIRLQRVQIECADALRIIRSRDTPETFTYADPPYIGTDMGHYDGYTEEDFDSLLKLLSEIEGRFLLSSYPSKMRDAYASTHGWHTVEIDASLSMAARTTPGKRKTEVLTANYPIS
jgi:DNA adenine methylase